MNPGVFLQASDLSGLRPSGRRGRAAGRSPGRARGILSNNGHLHGQTARARQVVGVLRCIASSMAERALRRRIGVAPPARRAV